MPWSKKKKGYTNADLLGDDLYAELLHDDSFDKWCRELLNESDRSLDAVLKQIEKDDALLFGTQTAPKPEPPPLPSPVLSPTESEPQPPVPSPTSATAPVTPKKPPIDKAARQQKRQVRQAIQLLLDQKSIFETAMTTGISPSELTDLLIHDRPFRRDLDAAIEDRQALAAQGDDTVAVRRYEQPIEPDIQLSETSPPESQPPIQPEIRSPEMQSPLPLEIQQPVAPEQPPIQSEAQTPPEQPISVHKRLLQALYDELRWLIAGVERLVGFAISRYTRKD